MVKGNSGNDGGGFMKLGGYIKMIFGFVLLVCGGVGVLVPLWPTTPFVLLAVWCFSATPWVQRKILAIGFFREHYDNYTTGKGLDRKTVVESLIFLWSMLGLSGFFSQEPRVILLLCIVGVSVTGHILWVAHGKGE